MPLHSLILHSHPIARPWLTPIACALRQVASAIAVFRGRGVALVLLALRPLQAHLLVALAPARAIGSAPSRHCLRLAGNVQTFLHAGADAMGSAPSRSVGRGVEGVIDQRRR